MKSVRPIDFHNSDLAWESGYRGKLIYSGEGCFLIATKVPSGVEGPATHIHRGDQIYYVIEGEITIRLGSEVMTASPNSVIFIPAGVPHHNWNAGNIDEVHLEIIAPGGLPMGRPLSERTDSTDAGGLPYYIRSTDESRFTGIPGVEGMTVDRLVTRDSGSLHVGLYLADIPVGAGGPALHIHEFDQFYMVLEGTLSVEVGFEKYVVEPNHLVVLPAGVPHRQWNEGSVPERHVAILAPHPEAPSSPEKPWDTLVSLTRELRPSRTRLEQKNR